MELKAMMESARAQKWWNIAWVLCAGYVVFLTIQQHFGLGLTKTLPVEVRKIAVDEELKFYEWRLPHRYRNPLMTHRAVLLEDGWPLQSAERVKELIDSGPGWFNIFRDLTRFLPADGSDPRKNGRRYEMVVPKQYEGREIWVPWLILILLSFKVRGSSLWRLPELDSKRAAALVLLVALAVGGFRMWQAGLYSDGVFTVGGQPESDAAAWYDHAHGLAEGWGITTGFSGQRPMYGVLMAPLFWLPGDPLLWIKLLNLCLWATAAAAVFVMGRTLQGNLLGLVCAVALMAGETHLPHVLAVLTENPGLAFGILATGSLWFGVVRGRVALIVISGLLTGFSNLTSGATMLALPAIALWVVVMGWRSKGFKTGFIWAGVFTVAVSAVLLPWMIRQKIVMGTMSPSTNSSTLLRGGADPVHKRMWPTMMDEPLEKAGIPREDEGGNYAYHAKIYRELVAEDPVRYIKQVANAWWESFTFLRVGDPGLRLAALVLLLACGLHHVWMHRGVRGLLVAMLLGLGFLEVDRPIAAWIVLTGLALSLIAHWRKPTFWLVALLALNLFGGTFLSGMVGNQTAGRMWQVMDWAAFLLVLGALHSVWMLCSSVRLTSSPEESADADATLSRLGYAWSIAGIASVVLCLVAAWLGPKITTAPVVAEQIKSEALQRIASSHPNPAIRSRTDLGVDVIRLGHRRYLQPAGYDTGHWLSHYRRRSFDRWVMAPERAEVNAPPDKRSYIPSQARGDLADVPAQQVVLWVYAKATQTSGISSKPYETTDGVALVPMENDAPQWDAIRWLEPVDAKLP